MRFCDENKKKRSLCFALILILTAAAVTFLLSHREKEPLSETRFMLDTVCSVTLYEWPGGGSSILDGAFGVCGKYEKQLSATAPSSEIYLINHSDGNPVEVSQETAELLQRAIEYCRMSGGAFDITIYPAKSLWHFNGDDASLPDPESLAHAASLVDYTRISLDGRTVTLPAGMGIDLGAIAKGFIADRIAEYLREKNVASAVIDLGGNVYTVGSKPDGTRWRVGIRQPFGEGEADVVETVDSSVVTSGVYQRYFEKDGKLYHHILGSSDGMPCDTGLYSVTILSGSSEQCDALSTICMLLGYEKSLALLSEFPETEAVFITSDNRLLYYGKE